MCATNDSLLQSLEKLTNRQNDDVFQLLGTNSGDYAAACALDFSHPPAFCDTFALRDAERHEILMQTWPYFRAKRSRNAMLANLPIPVASCWNGMGKFERLYGQSQCCHTQIEAIS